MLMIIVIIVLGFCIGSFINALVWRTKHNLNRTKSQPKLSIINGRSICSNCGHQLAARDLVPVLSWLSLRGKCRYCKQKIEDSPLVELLTAGLFLLSYLYWPENFSATQAILFGLWLVFLTGLIALAVYDLRWYILPNSIIYPLLGLAALQTAALVFVDSFGFSSAKEALLGLAIGGGLFYILFQLSKGQWIGGGDVKLGALLGLLVGGPLASFFMLFLASLLGSVVAVPLLLSGRAEKKTRLPFGPFLIIAAIVIKLFGASIISWYKQKILL